MQLVSTGEWLSLLAPTTPQLRFLSCLDGDVQSVQVAYETYQHDGSQLEKLRGLALGEMNARVIHHAKTFVCAMRRVGRVLEMADQKHFPREVAQVIKYQRKVTKAFFEQYVEPRNGIEHYAEEVRAPYDPARKPESIALDDATKILLPVFEDIGLHRKRLVVGGAQAEISEAAVKNVTEMREAIVTAAKLHLNRRSPDQPFGVIRMDFE